MNKTLLLFILIFFVMLSMTTLPPIHSKEITPIRFTSLEEATEIQFKKKTEYHLKNLRDKFLEKELFFRLKEFLKSSRPNRFPGSQGHKDAQVFIENVLEKIVQSSRASLVNQKIFLETDSLTAPEEFFKNFQTNVKFKNFYVTIPESFPATPKLYQTPSFKHLIIFTNYDMKFPETIQDRKKIYELQSAGADKNASAVALLLYLIEWSAKISWPFSITIAFLDGEDEFMLGSKNLDLYVKRKYSSISPADILALNLQTLAFDTKVQDLTKKNFNFALTYDFSQEKIYKPLFDRLKISFGKVFKSGVQPFTLNTIDLEYQNNFPKNENGKSYPLMIFSSDYVNNPNKNINTPNDFVETLNSKSYHQFLKFFSTFLLHEAFTLN